MSKTSSSEKVKLAYKKLVELGKKPKTKNPMDILSQVQKLGYDWDNEINDWIDKTKQTIINVTSDITIIDDLLEQIKDLVENFEGAELVLKNQPITYQAKTKDNKPIENMKRFYLVYTNNSLNECLSLDDMDIDFDSDVNEDEE